MSIFLTFDKFDMNVNNIDNLIHDFEQNVKEVYGPYSSDLKGFSAKEVANCFFVIFSLLVNQRTIDSFVRNRMNEKDSYISMFHSTISNSISNEFERTLSEYFEDPKATDTELMLIIRRFHSIIDECAKLKCEFLGHTLSVPEKKPFFISLVKRFEKNHFEEGLREWNSLPKRQQIKYTESSAQFKEKIMKENEKETKNEFPPFIWFYREVIGAKETKRKLEKDIDMLPFYQTALIYDIIVGSQRCVDSEPISMPLLYSVLSFMLRDINDPEMNKTIEI